MSPAIFSCRPRAGPELLTMWFGESERNVRDVFDKVRAAPTHARTHAGEQRRRG